MSESSTFGSQAAFPIQPADITVPTQRWRAHEAEYGHRIIPEETPVAVTYNRRTHAVMMATPADLQDFAIGFSLAERIVARAGDIEELDIVTAPGGVELRMWIAPDRLDALDARRRSLAGVTGCGMCGLDSLVQATRPPPAVPDGPPVTAAAVRHALQAMTSGQGLNRRSRALHAAAFVGGGHAIVREDVGRHNALDKLAGALAGAGIAPRTGIVAMTSRISVELVQKLAEMAAPIMVAVSAPTALAVRVAEQAGITLIGVARDDGFEVFTHAYRVTI